MNEDERLREALLELEILRGRDAERIRETQSILAALEIMSSGIDLDESIRALLLSIKTALDCGAVVLLETGQEDQIIRNSSDSSVEGARWRAPGLMTRPRRIVDIDRTPGLWESLPEELSGWRSLLSVPLSSETQPMALVAFDSEVGKFSSSDADLLNRLSSVASQGILRRQLEQRSGFLASVIDHSPVSVAIAAAKPDLPLIYVNDAFIELTGYDRADVLGKNCRFLTAEEPDSQVRSDIRDVVSTFSEGTFTLRNRRRDGSLFWNELRLFPVGDAAGNVTHLIATQTDVSARLQAEEDRDQARRRLESALEATAEAFLVLGRQGHIRFANAPFHSLFPECEITRDGLLEPDLASKVLNCAVSDLPARPAEAFQEERTNEFGTADGRLFQLRARPMAGGGAVLAASDITQLKVSERSLGQRLAAIERSQDGVAIGDADGRVVDANPSLVALWSLETEVEALGQKWLSHYDTASVERFEVAESSYRRHGVWRGELTRKTSAGRRIHDVSLSLVPEVGSVLIVRDITEQNRNSEERAALRQELVRAQMQERIHRISGGLAHDLNNLLSAILGSASFIETAAELPDEAIQAVRRIQSAAEHAADLMESFLDLGARERTAELIDLKSVVRNTVDLARGGAESRVKLTSRLPAGSLFVHANQSDILQIVMNLVVNGVDAHAGGSGEVRVSLRGPESPSEDRKSLSGALNASRAYAVIDVEDTGKGMDPDLAVKILEPYFTTKGNTGSGLGLSVVASIIADNDGALELETELGRGSRFTVWWPLDRATETQPRLEVGQEEDATAKPILVIDDVPEVASAIASELQEAGFEVAETNDPEMAIETIAEDPEGWGCVITDYDMPGKNGGDVIEALEEISPRLPIIVVSALARRLTDQRLKRAISVLQKPIRDDRLIAAVRNATGASKVEPGGDA